ncbi:MAG: hypothetical protein JRF08_07745 [Deltaproteobacteria bacterium]|nr:hypothetical protein [Deltaproteobacteria bacterium]MBW2333305.1 hypothetical protein [Deltaproteobacteria bacterium]
MEAIEFKTKIKKGTIQIPKKYKQRTGNTVKVIIISEQGTKQADIIDKLLANPIKSKDFSPFLREEIYERL